MCIGNIIYHEMGRRREEVKIKYFSSFFLFLIFLEKLVRKINKQRITIYAVGDLL